MFEYGAWDFRQRYEVPEMLKGLQQCQKTNARRRFSGPLFRPHQLHEVRRVYISQLPGGRSTLHLRIRRIPDSRHVNGGLWLQRLILKQNEPSVTI
jgi:hypothetical protein